MFQKYGYKLADAIHLSDLIPLILDEEVKKVATEIGKCKLHIIFDGASNDGECFRLMFRFVSEWKVYQRVINIDMLVKSMKFQHLL